MEIQIPNNWNPRDYQVPAWKNLCMGGKRSCILAHRRWGKDDIALHWAAVSAMEKPATYWHMLPEASQARKAIWEAVNPHTGTRRIDEAFPLEIRENTRENEMMIRFVNGATWQVVGSDNYNSLIGSPPYGLIYSEWSVSDPSSWAYLRPILAENGGWAIFIYTARGKNHGYSLYNMAKESEDWYCLKSTVADTNVFTEEQLQRELVEMQAEHGVEAGRAYWLQEYFCSFDAAIPGAYYMDAMAEAERQGRITRVVYDKSRPVHTWWDIGTSDYTTIWFAQYFGNEVRLIDYYQYNNAGPEHYIEVLKEKGYSYAEHNLPHDAGAGRFTFGAKTYQEMFQEMWPVEKWVVHPVTKSVNADINVARTFMARCVWDEKACEVGLESLRSYAKKWNEANKIYGDKPHHNWASHGADAFRYLAVGWSAETNQPPPLVGSNGLPTFMAIKTRKSSGRI